MLVVFVGLMYWISQRGEILEADKLIEPSATVKPDARPFEIFQDVFTHNVTHPLAILILQVIAIILVSRLFSFLFNKIGQPTVIGEIIAGITLGPSILGLFLPEASVFLFPAGSLPNLQFLSQVGLILFMFVIGMELDLKVLRNQAHDAVVISHASIIIPYFLGMGLAYYMYEEFAPDNISFLA